MTPDPKKYGKTEIGPINMLEPIVVDFSHGRPINPNMSKAEIGPINMLPEAVLEMQPVQPVLELTLCLRPGASIPQAVADGVALVSALDQYERTLGGKGLTYIRTPLPAEPNKVRIVLTPTLKSGAKERLERVAAAVAESRSANGPIAAVPAAGQGAVFDGLSAQVTIGVGA